MARTRRFAVALLAASAAGLLPSCSRDNRPHRVAVPTPYEQEIVRKKVQVAVEARHRAEQESRFQTLQAIAAREQSSLEGRAREFAVRWQTFFARLAARKRVREEQAREEWARLSPADRQTVEALRQKLDSGQSLAPGEEEFALDKKSLAAIFGPYLVTQVREYPSRKRFLSQISGFRTILEQAEEEERLGHHEVKARADLAAFAAQVGQMKATAAHIRESHIDRAAADLTAALAQSPFVPEFYALRGAVFCLALEELDRAIADLDEALRLHSADAWAWYCRGVAHWLQGRLPAAREDFQAALRIDPALAGPVHEMDPMGR